MTITPSVITPTTIPYRTTQVNKWRDPKCQSITLIVSGILCLLVQESILSASLAVQIYCPKETDTTKLMLLVRISGIFYALGPVLIFFGIQNAVLN